MEITLDLTKQQLVQLYKFTRLNGVPNDPAMTDVRDQLEAVIGPIHVQFPQTLTKAQVDKFKQLSDTAQGAGRSGDVTIQAFNTNGDVLISDEAADLVVKTDGTT